MTMLLRIDSVSFGYPLRRGLFRKPEIAARVLRDVSLETRGGELFGLIGPNGAGKSTLIKLVLSILEPQAGSIELAGGPRRDLASTAWKSELGFLSGAATKLFGTLSLGEQLILYSRLYAHFDRAWAEARLDGLGLGGKLERTPSGISFGERIKFELVLTLASGPRLLLLDEPTVGLDPVAIDDVRELIAAYVREHAATGIVTSHNLNDIVSLCASGGFLEAGTLTNRFDTRATSVGELEAHYRKVFGRG